MSDNHLVKSFPVSRKIKRPPTPSSALFPSAPSGRRGRNTKLIRRLSKSSRPVENLKRCNSEPALRRVRESDIGHRDWDHERCWTPAAEGKGVVFRPQTCTGVFSRSSSEYTLLPGCPRKSFEGYKYNKDAKVVVNVIVEGSPGPIRTMVRLGSSVEEAIRLFTQKYSEEGRTPRLDKDAATTFQLHHSYFSLQCLDRCNAIGDAGSRSFYLRKGNSHWNWSSSTASLNSGYISDKNSAGSNQRPVAFLFDLIVVKLHKFIRKTHKLCTFLICIDCSR